MLKKSTVIIRKGVKTTVNKVLVDNVKVRAVNIKRKTVTNKPIMKKVDIANEKKYKKLMNLLK